MRKIITRDEIEKKETRNKTIVGVVLVLIMVTSTLAYSFFSAEPEEKREKITYNGIEFSEQENGLWRFEIQGTVFYTQYTPQETENIISVIFRGPGDYGGRTLFFIGEGPGRREIETNMVGKIVPRSQDGCIIEYEENCKNNTPIKECSSDNIIIIEESEDIELVQDENCIIMKSPYQEQTRIADAFLFKLLGIK
jgi:hypothetical protein